MTRPSPRSTRSVVPDLRRLCGGAVCLPGDPQYDDACRPWNLRADGHPAAVAYPAFPDEVAELVRAAARDVYGSRRRAPVTGRRRYPVSSVRPCCCARRQ